MLKNVVAPIQAWLLSQGRCVADGQPLIASPKKEKRKDGTYLVTHSCNRAFIYDPKTKKYRRALLSEIHK